jgi:hypothetical protein
MGFLGRLRPPWEALPGDVYSSLKMLPMLRTDPYFGFFAFFWAM